MSHSLLRSAPLHTPNLIPIAVPFVDDAMKITGVRWSDSDSTQIEVMSKRSGLTYVVEFESVEGLRLLDELNIASFWIGASKEVLQRTWLFQVDSGGWLELECTRNDFYIQHQESKPHEFLIAGYQECLSILSFFPPRVCERL